MTFLPKYREHLAALIQSSAIRIEVELSTLWKKRGRKRVNNTLIERPL